MVKAGIGAWSVRESAVIPQLISMTTGHNLRMRLVDKPGLTQSFIALGFPGIKRSDPDYFAYLAMNHVLGGASFASRLMSVVRAQKGKTYGISSRFEAGVQPGPFMIRTFTQTGQAKEMVDLIVKVMTEMKEKGITEEELTRMKTSQIGGYQLRFQTPQDLAREILTVERYDLGPEYLKTYPEKINGLTIEEVNWEARRYLDVEGFALVIVGDRSTVDTIIKPLGRFETVPFENLYTR
jgi:zinc protease